MSSTDATGAAGYRRPILHSVVTEGLPTLPRFVFGLTDLLSREGTSLAEIAVLLSADPSLTAQLLRMANAGSSSVWKIDAAISQLSREDLRTLVLTCALAENTLAGNSLAEPKDFWYHSQLAACLVRAAARATDSVEPELGYVAGLLHDLGRLPLMMLNSELEPEPAQVHPDEPTLEWEANRYGMNHCEVGRSLGIAWGFPKALVDVMEMHHTPDLAETHRDLVGLVAAADLFYHRHRAILAGESQEHSLWPASEFLNKIQQWVPGLGVAGCSRVAAAMEEEWPQAIAYRETKNGGTDFAGVQGRKQIG